jgi:plastocyanin
LTDQHADKEPTMQHLDNLDSRHLQATDCYGQRFMREGSFSYHVLPAGGGAVNLDRPFSITVGTRKSEGKMTQHAVALAWDGERFVPDRGKLVIEAGDLVSWNCPDQKAPAYEVAGDKPFFDSSTLTNECGYSHAFGMPGTYTWRDAHGSGLHGVVRVKAVACATRAQLAHWRVQVGKAQLVMVNQGKAEPAEVDIVVGQTVYFAIVTGPGVSITDQRLLQAQQDCHDKRKAA